MDYKKFFSESINSLKKSGEYRIFRDIGRIAGSYPNAKFNNITKEENIIVWCSNDYLGMGQHPFVIEAIERAMKEIGVGSGGTRNISGTNLYHVALENEISNIHKEIGKVDQESRFLDESSSIKLIESSFPNSFNLFSIKI